MYGGGSDSLPYVGGKRHHLGTYESVSEAEEKSNAALAAKEGGTFEELSQMTYSHPTLSEMIKEAALDAHGHSIHM